MGIEPRTSRTRSQHYTTRLSRRRFYGDNDGDDDDCAIDDNDDGCTSVV